MVNLPSKASVTVPSKDRFGEPIEHRDAKVKTFVSYLAGEFGGVTETHGQGSWVNGSGQLMTENVTILTSFTDKPEKTALGSLQRIASRVRQELNQEAVLFEFNGKAFLLNDQDDQKDAHIDQAHAYVLEGRL